jgi:hypothetical protein
MNDLLKILCFDRLIKMNYSEDEQKALCWAGIVFMIILLVAIYVRQ